MSDHKHGQESAHERANKKKKIRQNHHARRKGKVVKKARELGAKLGAFIDFLSSARKEVLDREAGAWVHERRQDVTQEEYSERVALQDTARLLLDTRLKVLSLANKAHQNYQRVDEADPDRAQETTRLMNVETNRTYEALHTQSRIRLIPIHDKRKPTRSKAVTTFWNVAMVTLMAAHTVSSGFEAGLRATHNFRELAAYSEQVSYIGPQTASPSHSPFKTDKEKADFGKIANDAVKSWVSLKRKSMGRTNINSPWVVFVPMRSTQAGDLVREQFEVMGHRRELKIGKEHVTYA